MYNDYLMPSRLKEYERIIETALAHGYEHITLADYYDKLIDNALDKKRYFIHRHDIDTDIRTTKKMFKIEQKHGVKTSYYFRLSTLDIKLMKEINAFGSEASYHFEEIAQFCKDKHIKKKEEVLARMDEVKDIFKLNVKRIEEEGAFKLRSVVSHGDFVNRALKIVNNEITHDKKLREELSLTCEGYDDSLMNSFDAYISDKQYPIFYSPVNIFESIGKDDVICLLTHPRQWNTNFYVNTKDNIKRIYEGIKW